MELSGGLNSGSEFNPTIAVASTAFYALFARIIKHWAEPKLICTATLSKHLPGCNFKLGSKPCARRLHPGRVTLLDFGLRKCPLKIPSFFSKKWDSLNWWAQAAARDPQSCEIMSENKKLRKKTQFIHRKSPNNFLMHTTHISVASSSTRITWGQTLWFAHCYFLSGPPQNCSTPAVNPIFSVELCMYPYKGKETEPGWDKQKF